jgi:hypothetical protein
MISILRTASLSAGTQYLLKHSRGINAAMVHSAFIPGYINMRLRVCLQPARLHISKASMTKDDRTALDDYMLSKVDTQSSVYSQMVEKVLGVRVCVDGSTFSDAVEVRSCLLRKSSGWMCLLQHIVASVLGEFQLGHAHRW